MAKRSPDGSNAVLPPAEWPEADQALWRAATTPQRSPFRTEGGGRPRAHATHRKYAEAYGRFIGFLRRGFPDLLDRPAAQRLTPDVLDAYFVHLHEESRNTASTVTMRFVDLRFALQAMHPGVSFKQVTHPGGVPLTSLLRAEPKRGIVYNSGVLFLLAEDLFTQSLRQTGPWRRRAGVRDAVIIGLLVDQAPRRRTLSELRLGTHVYRVDGAWALDQAPDITKTGAMTGRGSLMPIEPTVAAWLDRYIAVERRELLCGGTSDAVWISNHGSPLAYHSLGEAIALRTRRVLGEPLRPHDFRASLATTEAMDGTASPLDAPAILGHTSPRTTLAHYNRATALAASRRHIERLKRLRGRSN